METDRLILRGWHKDDLDALARILGDRESRPFHPNVYSREQACDLLETYLGLQAPQDCLQAAQLKETGQLVGMVGLSPIGDVWRNTIVGNPKYELGWQFDKSVWGQGLAPEGARAWVEFAWRELSLSELVAFTYQGNQPSQRVMQKIGMTRDPAGDFLHPKLPADHPLKPHVLYRVKNPISAAQQ